MEPGSPGVKNRRRWARVLLVTAGFLTILSLGLPWGVGTADADGTIVPGAYIPGGCYTSYDLDGWASTVCDPGFVQPSLFVPGLDGGRARTGARSEVRVFLVAAWAAVAAGRTLGRPRLSASAPFVAGAGIVLGGLGNGTGFAAAVLATLLLFRSLQLEGIRWTRPRRSGAMPSVPGPRPGTVRSF